MSFSRIVLLGVPVDPVTSIEAVRRIQAFLATSEQRHVMTPNAEMLVEATRNPAFLHVLQAGYLNIPDSVGLLYAARWTRQKLPERVTGVDTVTRLCGEIGSEHAVFLLGGAEGIAEKAALKLKQNNPHLSIVGTYAGTPSRAGAHAIVDRINAARPQLLLVAYGAPKQDLWIAEHLSSMPSVRVAMGVGGTFDFLAGVQKRAPKVLQALGLEWFWRLLKEPRRFKRIWTAVLVFPLLVLRHGRNAPRKF